MASFFSSWPNSLSNLPTSFIPSLTSCFNSCSNFLSSGIALFLSHLAHEGKKVSELRATYPPYFIAKNRVDLTPEIDVDAILAKVKEIYKNEEINDIDGVKIDFADKWVHLRKSNTEPIIRVYSEASTMEAAEEIGQKIMDVINELAKK